MKLHVYKIFCVFYVNFLIGNEGVPLSKVRTLKFIDNWNYNTTPDYNPIVKNTNSHKLPKQMDNTKYYKHKTQANVMGSVEYTNWTEVQVNLTCANCKLVLSSFISEVKAGSELEDMEEKFMAICSGLEIETEAVCKGVFDMYAEEMIEILFSTSFTPEEICSIQMGEPFSCDNINIPANNWMIKLPDVQKPKETSLGPVSQDKPMFKVLHLTDIHLDNKYVEGSNAVCGEPLCCRENKKNLPKNEKQKAGKWGDYRKCDMPKNFVENMMEHLVMTHSDIDYIIWTGDGPPHDVWNQSKEESVQTMNDIYRMIKTAFPKVPLFLALGNHEGIPSGSFQPIWDNTVNPMAYLYDHLDWLTENFVTETTNNTIRHGGFYTYLVRPGFRIIALNTNFCYFINFWILVNNTDPANQLQWLVHTLQEAENKNEKVHIIGHIPPGITDCIKVWSSNYYKIISRYEKTVVGQFFGHTHGDEWEVFLDDETLSRPTTVAYIAPSATTYYDFNPAYRIYYVDGDHDQTTREVLDHETWVFDLESANAQREGKWSLLYTARNTYKLQSLRAEEWDNAITEMSTNKELFNEFHRLYWRDSPVRPQCNDKCRYNMLCDLRSGKSHSKKHLCKTLKETILGEATKVLKQSPKKAITDDGKAKPMKSPKDPKGYLKSEMQEPPPALSSSTAPPPPKRKHACIGHMCFFRSSSAPRFPIDNALIVFVCFVMSYSYLIM